MVLRMTETFFTTFNYLCKCNCRFQRLVLPFFPLLLYLVISSGLFCYCYLYSNEFMQVTCLHIVRSFPLSPALPSTQFTKLQKHGVGSHIKYSSTKFWGRAFTAYISFERFSLSLHHSLREKQVTSLFR